MRVLHDLGADDGLDTEDNDPIKRQILTLGEARRTFKTYVSHLAKQHMLMLQLL